MERDYPEKCKEIAKVLRERERKKMIETVKTTYSTHKSIDKHKLEHLRKKAIKGASEFNSNLRRERKDERRVYFDLQTMVSYYCAFVTLNEQSLFIDSKCTFHKENLN